jgi:hypothetical protein
MEFAAHCDMERGYRECSVRKYGKLILRKLKEIGCSESRILLLNARWKESYRVLSE